LNKVDAIPKSALAKKRTSLEKACGHKVLVISGVSGEGVDDVLRALVKEIVKKRAKPAATVHESKDWSP
jgi:GTP-binding protein